MRPTSRRRPLLAAAAVAVGVGVASGLVTTLLPVPPASAAADGPAAPAAAPATVEAPAPYVAQAVCDPVAKAGTRALADALLDHYGTGSVDIPRDCSAGGASEHKEGRALDWMLDAADPDEAAVAEAFLDWLAAPGPAGERAAAARRLGVMYVIWNREIWSPSRGVWQPYTGPHPHTDHVHVSLSWAGALGLTSWWTGSVARVDQGPCTPDPGPAGAPACGPGQEQPAPGPDTAAEPQEEPDTTGASAEERALAELAGLREESLARLETDGRWVAQLASKDVGIVDPLQTAQNGTHTFRAVDILAENRAALATVSDPADVLTLHGTDFGRHAPAGDGDPFWMTVVDVGAGSRDDVEAWCAATYPQLTGEELTNSCVPRRLTPPRG